MNKYIDLVKTKLVEAELKVSEFDKIINENYFHEHESAFFNRKYAAIRMYTLNDLLKEMTNLEESQ